MFQSGKAQLIELLGRFLLRLVVLTVTLVGTAYLIGLRIP